MQACNTMQCSNPIVCCGMEETGWAANVHATPDTKEVAVSETQSPEIPKEEHRDDALDDTFPASDPISIGGSTGPEDAQPPDTLEDNPSAGHPS